MLVEAVRVLVEDVRMLKHDVDCAVEAILVLECCIARQRVCIEIIVLVRSVRVVLKQVTVL